MGWLTRPAAVHDVRFHWFSANWALGVRIGDVGGLVRVTELRGPLKLVKQPTPCGPKARLAIPGSLMPKSTFSFAHKRNSSTFH